MNDQKLAMAIVDAGVGRAVKHIGNRDWRFFLYTDVADHLVQTPAKEFIYDWNVAGALMEKVDGVYVEALVGGCFQAQAIFDCTSTDWHEDLSTPRAIIEACVEALSTVTEGQTE